ncbi:hypothetical protein A9W96_18120 [Mycobacterium sp. 1245852.3]|nr:hypothetical protein A9W96_18120 [Mycobacterium sp. 1245852.3]
MKVALEIIGTLYPFGFARGAMTETFRWPDRALAATKVEPTPTWIRAFYRGALSAHLHGLPGDIQPGATSAAEAERLVQHITDPASHGLTAVSVGYAVML